MGEAKRRAARGEMPQQRGGHHDRDAEVRRLAAEMDQRVRQIAASSPSINDRALIEQMLGFLPGLQQIWTNTSDDTLARLCSEYPGFYRYARAMEEAFEAQRRGASGHPVDPEITELPASLKPVVARVLTRGAALEREMQELIDRFGRHAALGTHTSATAFAGDVARAGEVAAQYRDWLAGLGRMADEAHAAGVSQPSRQVPMKILVDVQARIRDRAGRLMDLALAGRAAAGQGASQ